MEAITLQTMTPAVQSTSSFKPSTQEGFSLLEMAMILVILGIIGAVSLPLLTAQISRAAILKTRSHQDYALNAIAAYVEKNKRFPCPADPQIKGPDYGLSQIHCRGKRAKGILPFKTLGISEAYVKDGFKRLMIYVVEPELTKRDTALQNEAGGFITIKTDENRSVIASPIPGDENPNYVAVVLISQGEKNEQHSAPQKDNFVFNESTSSNEILRWESRDQFLKHYVHLP